MPTVSSDFKVIEEVIKRDVYKGSNLIKDNELWLDIGANIGAFTLLALNKGARVICYEPCPRNIEKLQHAGLVVNEVAVSNVDGYLNFYLEKNNEWRHTLFKTRGRDVIQVKVINSKDLPDADGIKIDVEGSELDIIYGLRKLPNKLVLEYDGGKHPLKTTYDKFISYLKDNYTYVNYKPIKQDINFFPNGLIIICHTLLRSDC